VNLETTCEGKRKADYDIQALGKEAFRKTIEEMA
jgi:hypothetical protein